MPSRNEFETIVRRHQDAVYRQLFRMCGNQDDAEDVLSETLLKAYRALDSLENDSALRAWLVQIGRRTCGRLKKRQALRPVLGLAQIPESDLAAPGANALDLALEGELRDSLHQALDGLPPKLRDVYRLVEVEGASPAKVARDLGITVGNLKVRLFRARRRLRESIASQLNQSGLSDRLADR